MKPCVDRNELLLSDDEEFIEGYECKYILNTKLKEVYKSRTRRKLRVRLWDGREYPTVMLRSDNSTKYDFIPMVKLIYGEINEGEHYIFKDNDLFNMDKDNIIIGDMWDKQYYKHRNDDMYFDKYIKNRCCVLTETYQEAMEKGLIVVKPIVNYEKYLIDTDGNIYNTESGKYIKPIISDYGYIKASLYVNKKLMSKNVIRILAETFMSKEYTKGDMITYKVFKSRKDIDITNLTWCNKSNLVKKYHKNNPGHAEKYLHNSRISRKVYVNNIKFASLTEAAVSIRSAMLKETGIDKRVPTIRNSIANRMKATGCKKPLYGKYVVSKKPIKERNGK